MIDSFPNAVIGNIPFLVHVAYAGMRNFPLLMLGKKLGSVEKSLTSLNAHVTQPKTLLLAGSP